MTTLVIPSVVKRNALSVVGNGLFVHGRLVDPDAEFINAITDRQVNGFIGEFSRCYVVDVTSHCNMSCRYCYYKVDNTTVNRSVSSIVAEAVSSKFQNICLMGAEPTTRDDLPKIIQELSSLGLTVGITTNGKKLENVQYCQSLKDAGLSYLNYSMHYTSEIKLGKKKAAVLKNILDCQIGICQLSFTVSSIYEVGQAAHLIDFLINLGVSPSQFVIRAGAAIGNCTRDSGLFMSDMVRTILAFGAEKMPSGGSNLYFQEFMFRGKNIHLVRWPDNETVTPYSRTGPTFGTPLGPMLSPVFQVVSAMTQTQIEEEKKVLALPNVWDVKHEVSRSFGRVWAAERIGVPGKLWIHCEIESFGMNELRECRKIWKEFQESLLGMGYKRIYSCIKTDDKTVAHWQRLFGMKETRTKNGFSIYEKELNHGL